jgi:general L-amino acid transport system permease protein
MATLTDPPREGFRLSQLIYDTRYRSTTIQAVAFILIMSGLYWLANNTVQNLAALGKDFNFAFLENRAGLRHQPAPDRILQRQHPWPRRAGRHPQHAARRVSRLHRGHHSRRLRRCAAPVQELARARLMAVYVEGFRNIPLLLWILVIFAVMTESTPQPRDFRGEDASASMILFDSVAVTNRGIFMPGPVWVPKRDPPVAVFLLSLVAIWAFRRYARRVRKADRRHPSGLLDFARPASSCRRSSSTSSSVDRCLWITRAWWVQLFRRHSAAELADRVVVRAVALHRGLHRRDRPRRHPGRVKGQTEAAFALGLRPNRTMNLVILPQALRVIIPPLISQYLNLTKNSSLAIAVGYMDVRSTLGGITINQTGRELEGMLLLGLFYLVTSLIISGAMNIYNNSVKLKER